jgi:hypothetical protein
LTPEEFARSQQFLNQLEVSASQARNACRSLLMMMNSVNMAPTFNVVFDPENLNSQLNSILFESSNLGEALTKLRYRPTAGRGLRQRN